MSVHHHQHLYWLAEFCLSSGEMLNTLTVIDWTAWGCNSPDYVHQRQVLHRDTVFTMRLSNSFMTTSITATDGEQDEDHFSEWVTFLLISGINDWQWFVGFDKITSCNETKPLNSESGIIDSVVWKSFLQSEFKGGFRYRRFKFIWRFFYIEKVDEIDFLCLHLFFHSFIHLFSSTNGGMFMPGAGESGKMRQLTRPLNDIHEAHYRQRESMRKITRSQILQGKPKNFTSSESRCKIPERHNSITKFYDVNSKLYF